MTNEHRIEAISRLDVDGVVVLPFSRSFASQEPEKFLASAFSQGVPAFMHVGSDFRFRRPCLGDGRDARGVRLGQRDEGVRP